MNQNNIILFEFFTMVPELNYTDSNDNNILHHIVSTGDINMVYKFLKEADTKGNLKEIVFKYNDEGKTPLHLAVSNNYQEIADVLIKFGASKDMTDNKGQKVMWVPEQKGGGNKLYGKRYI